MPRASLAARIQVLSDTQRLALHCAAENVALARRLSPDRLAALDETGVALLEADVARRQAEDAWMAGIAAMVEEWKAEGYPG